MTSSGPESLASRYRPQTFKDVVGQKNAVEFLRGLCRGRIARHILLHGSVGSGKTTLARIYARALNCELPAADGSPCLECAGCKSVDVDPLLFAEIDAPRYQDERSFRTAIDAVQTPPIQLTARRVIFIDEAHSLRRLAGSSDYLLKVLEEAPKTLSFILATTQPEDLSRALRSRLSELAVHPMLPEQGIQLLRSVAEKERFKSVDNEALLLIWRMAGGHARNMLNALDQLNVRDIGITRDHVCDVFDVRDIDTLLAYFVALGEGDFDRQSECFLSWHASVKLKISRIQALLVQIYYNDIVGHPVFVDAIVSSITPDERARVVTAFQNRIPDAAALKRAFQEMLLLLPVYLSEAGDESLLAQLILFQERVCASDFGMKNVSRAEELPAVAASVASPKRGASAGPKLRDPQHLSSERVKKIFNSASAFTQAYGRQFNVKITVYHDAFGCADQESAGKNAGQFTQQLSQRLRGRYGYGDRMLVQEHHPSRGPCARVISSLPNLNEGTVADLQRWIRHWKQNRRSGESAREAIEFEIANKEAAKMGAHWECVRWLCAGLSPADPAHKILKLGTRPAGDIGLGRRYAASDSCDKDLEQIVRDQSVSFLSAFNSAAWAELYAGWEMEVYEARRSLFLKQGVDLNAAAAEFGAFCKRVAQERNLQFWNPNDSL